MPPTVTVLMSVHNGLPFVREAVETMLRQSFGDFEFLILDDASTDGTSDYLRSVEDKRVRVISLTENIGLTAALNHGLREAQGEFIARQDADDIARPDRLDLQIRFLQNNPKCVAVGSQLKLIDSQGRSLGKKDLPLEHQGIVFAHLFDNAFAHSAVVFRRKEVEAVGRYDESWPTSQDYELWSRLSERGELRNLPERLVTLRALETSITRTHRRADLIRRIQAIHFERVFGRPATSEELDLIGLVRTRVNPERLNDYRALLERMIADFERRNPGASGSADFRRTLAMLHERVGYNLLTVSRGSAFGEIWKALRVWPRAAFTMPWARILALGIAGDGVRRMYEKLTR